MGLFDRLRKDKPSPDMEEFEALMSEMTRDGVVIVTRDNGNYTVYWARRQDDPLVMQTSVDALKRSFEGKGTTALEAILDCRERAAKRATAAPGANGTVVAKTVVRTTTTTTVEQSPPPEKPGSQ